MHRLAVLVAALVCACASQPVLHVVPGTQPLSTLPRPGDHFDCIAAYGRYFRTRRPIHGSMLATGSAYFRATWTPGTWAPSATITVRGDDHTQQVAGIALLEPPGKSFTVVDTESYVPGHGLHQESLDHLAPILGEQVSFALRLDGNRLEVRAGSAPWTAVPLSFTPHDLELSCSSAEVIFHDLNATEPAPP